MSFMGRGRKFKPVINIKTGQIYDSVRAAAKAAQVSEGTMSRWLSGNIPASMDMTWSFEDNDSLEYLKQLRPLNPYGWSKASFDIKVAREISEGRGCPKQYAGLKFFNVYGPNEYHKGGQKSVICHIFPNVKENKPVKLFKSYNANYKDGWQLRDFIYVNDVVDVIVWLLQNPKINGLFNVGTGTARSFYDLAKATWNALGLEEKVEFVDMPENIRDRYQYYTQANISKLRTAGYTKPMTSLEDGVNDYVTKYLNRDDIYR